MEDLKKHQKKMQEDEIRMLQEEAAKEVFNERDGIVVDVNEFDMDDSDEDVLMQLDI